MGIISINGLRLMAHHGVMEQERHVGNTFEISISLDVPMSDSAMLTDNLADTINYAEVVEIIRREMATPSKLIEHVAGRIHKALRARYGTAIAHGQIELHKLAPPIPAELDSVSYTYKW